MDGLPARPPRERRQRDVVAAWHASGQTLQAFSEQTGESLWSLRRWRAKYGAELGIARYKRAIGSHRWLDVTPVPAQLMPVEIAGAAAVPPMSEPTAQIRLCSDRTLIVSTAIDPAVLTRMISAIECAP